MAIKITEDCINCGACEAECPNTAIYEGGVNWNYADGTNLKGLVSLTNGQEVDADQQRDPVDDELYYIVTDKCTLTS